MFYGNGDGTLQMPLTLPVLEPWGVVAGRLLGGSAQAIAASSVDKVVLFERTGVRQFDVTEEITLPSPVQTLLARDFNQDGRLDLLGWSESTNQIHVLLGKCP